MYNNNHMLNPAMGYFSKFTFCSSVRDNVSVIGTEK